jgi:uncharacterized membrane protein (UPF0127 family)
MPPRFLSFSLIFLLLLIGSFVYFSRAKPTETTKPNLQAGNSKLTVEVVETPTAIQQGLSGRDSLAPDSGLYFMLGERRTRSFWMKEMKFPLDIVWIDGERVIGIEKNAPVPTGSKIPTFTSPGPVTHVLEVNAGWTEQHNLKIDDTVKMI